MNFNKIVHSSNLLAVIEMNQIPSYMPDHLTFENNLFFQ